LQITDLGRRRTRRYKLADPVDFWWLTASGSVEAGHGMTLDISSSGVLIVARRCPPIGVRIQTTIRVARRGGSNQSLELHGEGIVVRIGPGKGILPGRRSKSFAASLHFYSELSNNSDDSVQEIQGSSERRNTFTTGRVDKSSGWAEVVSPFSRSEL